MEQNGNGKERNLQREQGSGNAAWNSTKVWHVLSSFSKEGLGPEKEAKQALHEAGQVLAQGGTVAFPTETVYGLGADAGNTEAVERIFAAKGRPSDNPLIVHISELAQLDGLVQRVNETERALMASFWPGPLSLVLPVKPGAVSPRDGRARYGCRADAGSPRGAGSDQRRRLSARRAERQPFRPAKPDAGQPCAGGSGGAIDGVLDGGPAGVGVESTVVQVGEDGAVTVLRPGGVTAEQLAAVAASVRQTRRCSAPPGRRRARRRARRA